MRRAFLFFIFTISILFADAQGLSFTDSARISLLTCSPGNEVYEKFGHTAIRINDTNANIDVVFNYGIFDFETSGFYYKFIKGETDYQLGIYNTSNFLAAYANRNSGVTEQILNLTVAEKRNLTNKLLVNYQPENRIYRYNFIFDNCSTRPRDKIQESLNGYIKYESTTESKTFRQWVEFYVGTETWASFGINLAFGMPADQAATQNESMFLPEVLMNEFQHAEIINHEKQPRKLISEKKTLVLLKENTEQISKLTKPLVISIILLILGTLLTIWDLYKNQHHKPFDSFLYIITGFGGIILSYLALFSVHPLVKLNLNILWMNPINLVLGILMWFPKLRTPIFFYEILNILLLVCALIAFALSVQIFNLASFPLIVLLLLRSTAWVVYLKKRMFKRRSVI